MNYSIQSGDNLCNIAKKQYKLTSNTDIADKYDKWTNSLNPNETFEYANSTDSKDDIAKKAQELSELFINAKGNNDGNIDLTEFVNANPEIVREDAEAIYKMIDMDGKNGITKDEYASYLMTIDAADGKLDGNMNTDNFNTVGAQLPVLAQEKYATGQTQQLYAKAKQGLDNVTQLMQNYRSKYFSSSENSDTSSADNTSCSSSTNADDSKTSLNNFQQNLSDLNSGKDNQFSMFNFNPSSYSSDLKNYAQSVIKNNDTNQDGKLDVNEFLKTVLGDNVDNVSEDIKNKLIKKFNSMNLDSDAAKLSTEELATEFFAVDCDWSTFAKEGDLTPDAIDGKFKFSEYLKSIILPSSSNEQYFNGIQTQKKNFYNHFYGKVTE